jgi:hypothetical protein
MTISISTNGTIIAQQCPELSVSSELNQPPETLGDLALRLIADSTKIYGTFVPTIQLLELYFGKLDKDAGQTDRLAKDAGQVGGQAEPPRVLAANIKLAELFSEMRIRGFRPYLKTEHNYTGRSRDTHVARFTTLRKHAEEYGFDREIPKPWRELVSQAGARHCLAFTDHFAETKESPADVTVEDAEDLARLLAKDGGYSWEATKAQENRFLKLLRDNGFTEQQPLATVRDKDYAVQPTKMPDIPLKTQAEKFRSFILSSSSVNKTGTKWAPKPWDTPTKYDLKREEGSGTRRPRTAQQAIDAIAMLYGFATKFCDLNIRDLKELLDYDLNVSFRNWSLRVRVKTGDAVRNPLAILYSNLKRWPEFDDVDLDWTDELLDDIPRTPQADVEKRKEGRYLLLEELDLIPDKVLADRKREEARLREAQANEERRGGRRSSYRVRKAEKSIRSQIKEVFRLVTAEFIFRFLCVWPWRGSNLCNCKLDGDTPNLFKGPILRPAMVQMTPSVKAIWRDDHNAEFWQVYIPPQDHKTGRRTKMEIRAVLPGEIPVDEYLKCREAFLHELRSECGALLVNTEGNPLSLRSLERLIEDIAFKYGGAPMNPHLFRDAHGDDCLMHHPEESENVAKGLFHTSDRTLKKSYSLRHNASFGANKLDELARRRREKREGELSIRRLKGTLSTNQIPKKTRHNDKQVRA